AERVAVGAGGGRRGQHDAASAGATAARRAAATRSRTARRSAGVIASVHAETANTSPATTAALASVSHVVTGTSVRTATSQTATGASAGGTGRWHGTRTRRSVTPRHGRTIRSRNADSITSIAVAVPAASPTSPFVRMPVTAHTAVTIG